MRSYVPMQCDWQSVPAYPLWPPLLPPVLAALRGRSAVGPGNRGQSSSVLRPGPPLRGHDVVWAPPALCGDANSHAPALTSPDRFPLPGTAADARLTPSPFQGSPLPGGGCGPTFCKPMMAQVPSAG